MITEEQLKHTTIAAIRICEASAVATGRWRYDWIAEAIDREVHSKYNVAPVLSGRIHPLVERGKDVDHVRVQAFGLDIQVRFRGSP